MKTLILIIFAYATSTVCAQTQDIHFYLSHPKVSKTAKDFYNKKFKVSDDDRTFSIFDSLNTKNNATRPFYIFLCSKIMEHSDGALSEFTGSCAKEFIEKHPKALFDFFKQPNKLLNTEKYIKIWAQQVAGEIAIECENKENLCLNTSIKIMKFSGKGIGQMGDRNINEFGSLIRSYLP